MLVLSKHRGTGGTIKASPESFVVEEITQNGTTLEAGKAYSNSDLREEADEEGKFARFVLQKSDWNTIQALREVAKKFGRGTKSVGYAGMKDKMATTVQLASIFGMKADGLQMLKIKDISINGAWQSKSGVENGDLLGNHFRITIASPDNPDNAGAILQELDGRMPNYFDKQRFGSRLNNQKIGLSMMKGDFESAAMEFLTGTENELNQEAVEARRRLKGDMDFKSAISYFPKYLKYERTVIEYLHRYEGNYANALRKLPRGITLMFVHSVEDIIFNYSVDKHIENCDFDKAKMRCGHNFYGFPDISKIGGKDDKNLVPLGNLIGYGTKEEDISDYEKDAMEKLGIKLESFKLHGMGELSMKGTVRPILTNFKDIRISWSYEGINVEFSLPSGSYATILINEITKGYGAFMGDVGDFAGVR